MLVADNNNNNNNNNNVVYGPVIRQIPLNKQRDNSRCYAMIVGWAVILDPFLANGLLNTFPQQRLHMQQWKQVLSMRSAPRSYKEQN
jgi:hypothetical protein